MFFKDSRVLKGTYCFSTSTLGGTFSFVMLLIIPLFSQEHIKETDDYHFIPKRLANF